METSAKDGTNVAEAFDAVVKGIMERVMDKQQTQHTSHQSNESTLNLGASASSGKKKKKGCNLC